MATEALTHLLLSSSAAAQVLHNVAVTLSPEGGFEGLVFSGQAVSANNDGRPDIVGADGTGPRVLVEAKFDASLTPPQSGTGYLNWLPQDQAGILVYLVPANRLPALWPQLLAGPCEQLDVPPPDLQHADEELLAQSLPGGRVVAAMSWEALMRRLHATLDGGGNFAAAADLSQLDGLVRSQTRSGWVPLALGDLSDRSGPQLVGLRDAVMRAAGAVTSKKVTSATGDLGPGRWVWTASGRPFRVGIHMDAWAKLGLSPVWATVWSKDPVQLSALRKGLDNLTHDGGPGVYRVNDKEWGVPIDAPYGAEIGSVAEHMTSQLSRISELLNAMPPADVNVASETDAEDVGAE
ncbi:MAG: hypothetical protein ACR2JU_11875 [Nocardioidaceae bacterium]